MATEIVKYTWDADTKKFTKSMKEAEKSSKDMDKNFGSRMDNIGKKSQAAGVKLVAVSSAIIFAGKKFLDASTQQAEAETKLEAAMKGRINATSEEIAAVKKVASETQKLGVIGDEVIIAGQGQLATYTNSTSALKKLTPVLANLTAKQGGLNATQEDSISAGNTLGKALMGNTSALKKQGITMTTAQENMLKYGTEEQKVDTITQVLNENIGDVNSALANTPEGRWQQLKNDLGDLAERIGFALIPVLDSLQKFMNEKVVPALEEFISFLENNPGIVSFVSSIVGISLALGGILLVVNPVISSIKGLTSVINEIGTAMKLANVQFLLIIGIIALVGFAIWKLWTDSEEFRTAVTEIFNKIKQVVTDVGNKFREIFIEKILPIIKEVMAKLQEAWVTIEPIFNKVVDILVNVLGVWVQWLGDRIKNIIDIIVIAIQVGWAIVSVIIDVIMWTINLLVGIIKGIGEAAKAVWTAVKSAFTKILDKIKSVWDWIKNFFSDPFKAIGESAEKAWDAVTKWFTKILDKIGKVKDKVLDFLNPFDAALEQNLEITATSGQLAPIHSTVNNTWNISDTSQAKSYGGLHALKSRARVVNGGGAWV